MNAFVCRDFHLPLLRSELTHSTHAHSWLRQYNVFSRFFLSVYLTHTHIHTQGHSVSHSFYRYNLSHFVCRTADSTFAKFILSLTFLRFMRKSFCLIFSGSRSLTPIHTRHTLRFTPCLSRELRIFCVQFFCHLFLGKRLPCVVHVNGII